MKSIKKYLIPLLLAVLLVIMLWLGFDGLKDIQDTNPDYTFFDNVVANFNAHSWIKVITVLLGGGAAAVVVGNTVKKWL